MLHLLKTGPESPEGGHGHQKAKHAIYTSCQLGKAPFTKSLNMSNKYNLIPGACHFEPFSTGNDVLLQYSYTNDDMYCKTRQVIGDAEFEYVEVRPLDTYEDDEDEGTGSKSQLDAMAANDFIRPMYLFGDLPGDEGAHEELNELFHSYCLSVASASELRESLEDLDPESEEYADVEALLEFNSEDMREARVSIERIIGRFNRDSGYDPKSGTVQVSAG